jgi:hypothetical protein
VPKPDTRRPAGRSAGVRSSFTGPNDGLDPLLGDEIELDVIYREPLQTCDPAWLDRYGEASWYAAITLFRLWTVDMDGHLEDIPEEYRWRGKSRRWPADPADETASEEGA